MKGVIEARGEDGIVDVQRCTNRHGCCSLTRRVRELDARGYEKEGVKRHGEEGATYRFRCGVTKTSVVN